MVLMALITYFYDGAAAFVGENQKTSRTRWCLNVPQAVQLARRLRQSALRNLKLGHYFFATKVDSATSAGDNEHGPSKSGRDLIIRSWSMKTASMMGALAVLLACSAGISAQTPNFRGSWTMDRARSFGLPGNMNQTMVVTQNGDQIEVETRLIQPGNERTVKDSYVLDGKERDFTPPTPPNAPASAPPPKGKRTAKWLPGTKGIVVDDVTTSETPKGAATTKVTRKWTISGNGELIIDMYVDSPNASYEAKRIFTRKE
jgi:hypothetical protein